LIKINEKIKCPDTVAHENARGTSITSIQLLHFIKMWLTQHIMDSDKEYVPYLLKAGLNAKSAQSGWFIISGINFSG
jgi:hemerythrin